MEERINVWLFDILLSIKEIESYFPSGEKKFINFSKDTRTKRAVERNLEIIGEAVRRIMDQDDSLGISSARRIVDTRNRIIHGYDMVSEEIIWGIIVNHLPILKSEVEKLLDL